MKISLQHISKKFNKQKILRDFSFTFESGERYVITGANGKGKSTLLKIASGYLSPDQGIVTFSENETTILHEQAFSKIAIQAPYIDVSEDLRLCEWFVFYNQFKKVNVSNDDFFEKTELPKNVQYKDLSTGMKQRFKLALAFYTESSVLFLDEPCAFLDEKWKAVYQSWVDNLPNSTTLILSSNDPFEYEQVKNVIQL